MSTPATTLRGISTAARRTLKAAGLDSCVIQATTSETIDTGRPPYRTLVWRTHVELTGVVNTKAEKVAEALRAVGHNAVAVDRRTVLAINPVGFKPCRCVNDKTECTSVHCRNNPPFPGEKRTPFGSTVRRCGAPSTKNATSAEHYTTCPGVLDEHGDCPEAGSHVQL
jgi:hypothetical protein